MDSNETWTQLEWNDESEDEDEDEDEDIDLETSNWSWSKRGGMFQYELPVQKVYSSQFLSSQSLHIKQFTNE